MDNSKTTTGIKFKDFGDKMCTWPYEQKGTHSKTKENPSPLKRLYKLLQTNGGVETRLLKTNVEIVSQRL